MQVKHQIDSFQYVSKIFSELKSDWKLYSHVARLEASAGLRFSVMDTSLVDSCYMSANLFDKSILSEI